MRGSQTHQLPALKKMDGSTVPLNAYDGKVRLVSYFQTWCSDCAKEQPELLKLEQRFTKDSLCILMISDEEVEKIAAFKNMFQSPLDFYQTDSRMKGDLGVSAYPTTYLIDKQGNVIIKKVEGINWYTPEVIAEIEKLIRN